MPTRHQRYRSMLHPRNDDGLGLVEMVVAVGVVMVVLISAAAAFVRMGEAQRSAEGADRGTQMIQDRLETIRKLRYQDVGCYGDDKDPVTGVPTCLINAPMSPPSAYNGEVTVRLGATRPMPHNPDDPIDPANSVSTIGDPVTGNKYTVSTVVTFAARKDVAGLPVPGDLVAPADYPSTGADPQSNAPYLAKRVTVTATWQLGAKTRSVTRQWLRAATSAEIIPPTAGTAGSGCSEGLHYPFCSISITDGQVLGANFLTTRSVAFTVQMSQPATAGTLAVGTYSRSLAVTNGKTLKHVAVIGTSFGTKPGPQTVSFTVNTPLGTVTETKKVNWRFPVAPTYALTNLHGVWDSARATVNTAPPTGVTTGTEQARDWFCVGSAGSTAGQLLRYTAVIVDETNTDDMDVYKPPNLYATGMDPVGLTGEALGVAGGGAAVLALHPSAPIANYAPVGGYVGTKKTAVGSLNTVRWSYGFQPGTRFPGATSTITISGERPGDGVAANASLTMRVYRVPDVSSCANAGAPTTLPTNPTSAPTVTDGGSGTIIVDWGDQAGATSYNVYRKIGAGGTYGPAVANTSTSSYTDPGPLESKLAYYYKFTAVNAGGQSQASPENSATITYDSMIRGDKPVAYHRLAEIGGSSGSTTNAYQSAVMASHPRGYWPLSEPVGATNVVNMVTGGGDGTATSVGFGQAGRPITPKFGSANFPWETSKITVPSSAALDVPGTITVEAWVNQSYNYNYSDRVIASKALNSNTYANNAFEFRIESQGRLQFNQSNATTWFSATGTKSLSLDTWHHVAATKSAAGVITFYIDGVADATSWGTANWPAAIPVNTSPMLIGADPNGGHFVQYLSDVALYDSALSSADITAHYNAPSGPVVTPSATPPAADSALGAWYSGVYVGAPTLGVSGINISPANTAMSLDGYGSQYVTLPAGISTKMGNKSSVSLEAWVYPTARPAPGTYPAIISEQYPSGPDMESSLFYFPEGQACFGIIQNGRWSQALEETAPPLNTWTHYVAVLDNGTLRLYRDGVEVAMGISAGGPTPAGGAGAWYIGKAWYKNESPKGKIDEVALYDTALSPARVKAHYDSGKS